MRLGTAVGHGIRAAGAAAAGVLRNPPLLVCLGVPVGLGQVVGLATLPAVFNW